MTCATLVDSEHGRYARGGLGGGEVNHRHNLSSHRCGIIQPLPSLYTQFRPIVRNAPFLQIGSSAESVGKNG